MRHLQGMFFSRPINASDTPAAQDEVDSTDLKPEKDLGEEDYTISSELIQAIKEQYLEKRETSSCQNGFKKRKFEEGEDEEDSEEKAAVVTFTPSVHFSFPSSSLIQKINAAKRENSRRNDEIDKEMQREEREREEKEVPLTISRLPLAASGLCTATKKRCADLCLRLIRQFSDYKNKVDSAAAAHSLNRSKELLRTTSVPLPATSSTTPATAPTTAPEPVADSNPLDASLPQAACQLLVHITRDREVRDHFESAGGVHRLIATIPPFEGLSHRFLAHFSPLLSTYILFILTLDSKML